MGKKHKNKVRVLPGRMYRLVRSDRSVYCDAENALRTCFIEETKEQQAGAVRKSGDQTPRSEKFNFIHKYAPFRADSVNELKF